MDKCQVGFFYRGISQKKIAKKSDSKVRLLILFYKIII